MLRSRILTTPSGPRSISCNQHVTRLAKPRSWLYCILSRTACSFGGKLRKLYTGCICQPDGPLSLLTFMVTFGVVCFGRRHQDITISLAVTWAVVGSLLVWCLVHCLRTKAIFDAGPFQDAQHRTSRAETRHLRSAVQSPKLPATTSESDTSFTQIDPTNTWENRTLI